MQETPFKKSDQDLFNLIELKIRQRKYYFARHAQLRQHERKISDLVVLNILEGRAGYDRRRNEKKDVYEAHYLNCNPEDWKYCIEGRDIDGNKIRIIVTFTEDQMPIITVINIR